MKVLITGDSHTGALRRGKDLIDDKIRSLPFELTIRPLGTGKSFATAFFADEGKHANIIDAKLSKSFGRLPLSPNEAEEDYIYGLSGPLHTNRIWRYLDWAKFAPYSLVENKEIPVSDALLRQAIWDDCKYLLEFIDIFTRNDKQIFVIEAPGPFRHHHIFRKVRADIIKYVDNFYREFVKQELNRRSVPVVSLSPNFLDNDGFMLPSFRHENVKDPHHGNGEFGKLMMERVVNFLFENQMENNSHA